MYEVKQCKSLCKECIRTLSATQRKNATQRIVLQRATLPNDFINHQEDMNSIGDKMVEIDGGGNVNSLSYFIKGTDNWAKETRLAAMRKYNEMETALRRYNLRGRKIRLGEDINTEADVEESGGCCEVKTVSGKKEQLYANINNAFKQLFVNKGGRVKDGMDGRIYMYLTDYFMENNFTDKEDPVEIIEAIICEYIKNHDPGKERSCTLVINFQDEEHTYP